MGDPVILICVLTGAMTVIIVGFIICRLICICVKTNTTTPLSEEDLTWRQVQ